MKKRIVVAMLTITAALSLAACGKKDEGTGNATSQEASTQDVNQAVKQELVKFINDDIPSIAGDRDTAVAAYNAYFSADSNGDSQEWLNKLESEAVIDYEVYLQSLKNLSYQSTEVQSLQQLYIQSAQSQFDAMKDVITAIKESDVSYLDSANEKIAQSKEYLDQYKAMLNDICVKYDITVNGAAATSTDAATE